MAFQPSGPAAHPAFQAYDPDRAARQHRLKVLALSLVALAGFLAFQAVLLARWSSLDTRPPAWDQAIQLETALDFKDALAQGRLSDALHPVPKPGMPPFPPAYHLALQPAMKSAHPERAALWVNFAYLVVLTLCTFGLVFEFRADWGAAAGAVAFVCAPAVQSLLYTQLIDLPLTACAAAAYWAFVRSDEFLQWLPSVAFGVLFGIGMLHKWSFFAYMIPCYFVGLKALGGSQRKGPVLVAWALAALIGLPWYLMNWPLLLPRLFQASADFAIPVWQGGAFFTYFWMSLSELGPALFFLGWIGLIVPKYRRNEDNGWLIPFWLLSSYVFWAIVPNRQMRFLLPGLPGLAVLATGSWPAALVAGMVGLQLAGAANFARGVVGPIVIPTPFGDTALLPNDPPKAEDWHLDDLLKEAETRSDPSEPISDLVIVANHPRFNGPTLNWRRRALGVPHVRIRGVNKRICEFARFVALKSGDLGPASVTGELPKVADQLRAKNSWFQRAYAKAASWPLPDGSELTLFERVKPSAAPFRAKGAVPFQYYTKGALSAEDMSVSLGAFDAASGVYPHAVVTARKAELRGLALTKLAVDLDDLLAVPVDLPPGDEWNDIRFIKLKTLRLRSVDVSEDALRSFLEARVKGLKLEAVTIDGTLKASGSLRGFPLSVELSAELLQAPRALKLRIVSLRLGPNPVPVGALNRIKELTVSLEPNPETPFAIELPSLTLKGGHLTVP